MNAWRVADQSQPCARERVGGDPPCRRRTAAADGFFRSIPHTFVLSRNDVATMMSWSLSSAARLSSEPTFPEKVVHVPCVPSPFIAYRANGPVAPLSCQKTSRVGSYTVKPPQMTVCELTGPRRHDFEAKLKSTGTVTFDGELLLCVFKHTKLFVGGW